MIKNIKLFKIKLRKKYRTIRESVSEEQKNLWDKKILDNLSILSAYKKSKIVLTYVSKKIEVDTHEIIKKCLSENKRVAVPLCQTQDRSMRFYFIKSFDDLELGTFGVLEPIAEKCEELTEFSQGFCIVPGFCFDQEGYRLGYGHGYYDRFLQNFSGVVAGICYSNCITRKLPHGRFDKHVDLLVTDKYIKQISCN